MLENKAGTARVSPPPSSPKRRLGRRRRRVRNTVVVLSIAAGLAIAGGLVYQWLTRTQLYTPGEDLPGITRKLARTLPEGAPKVRFTDVTQEVGLGSFRTFQGSRSSQLPEDMGSGAAWGDYDNDGDEDLFIVAAGGSLKLGPRDWAPSLLFENRGGTFAVVEDFPETRIIGMAAAWGDYDGDGWLDLVVTGYNTLRLFHNLQGKLVRDQGFPEPAGFWAGASWGDFNNDRRLDLYVCGYVRYVEEKIPTAGASQQFGMAVPYTLNPSSYKPARNLLFLNLGEGAFREVAGEMGVANPQGRSLTGLWHDFDQDGRLDLYVANDVSDNALFHNDGTKFSDISHSAWVADYRGAMGLALGDYNRDGDDDIFVTHWIAQENALYDSLFADLSEQPSGDTGVPPATQDSLHQGTGGSLRFMDLASVQGLGQPALKMVGWGAEFADFDADGWLDLFVANGSTFETDEIPPRLRPQNDFLFWNKKGEHFHDMAPTSPPLNVPHVSRGVALADYDNDGDVDILIVQHGEGVQLLRNDARQGNWLQVRLQSRHAADAPAFGKGENAVLTASLGEKRLRRAVTGPSYLSQSSRIVHFGLGTAPRADTLEVNWHAGMVDVYTNLEANALWEIRENDPQPRRLSTLVSRLTDEKSSDEITPGPPSKNRQNVVAFWSKQRAAVKAMKVDGDIQTAVRLFREALLLNPEHEDARYYLGNCLAQLGQVDAAIEELRELIRINPRSHRALKGLALLLTESAQTKNQLIEVMRLLERALAINREETGVLLAMGEIALILGDYEMADQRLKWACRTNPRAVSGFFFRGFLAWRKGDDGEARRLLTEATEARGNEWKPEGTTAEGDVKRQMHTEFSPLGQFWRQWQGSLDPQEAYASVDFYLKNNPLRGSR